MAPKATFEGTPPAYAAEVQMISHMRAILPKVFPALMNRGKWSDAWGVSRPWPTPMRGGRPAGGHFGGVVNRKLVKASATDIYLDADKPAEKRLGNLLFDALVRRRAELGISFVVWNEQTSRGGVVRAFPTKAGTCSGLNPWDTKSCLHRNHLHVEFDPVKGDEDRSAALRSVVSDVAMELVSPGK